MIPCLVEEQVEQVVLSQVHHHVVQTVGQGSGYRFPMLELLEAGARVCLGTDGAASSNNLDMIEVMKTAALLQKGWRGDPTVVPAQQIMSIAALDHSIAPGQPACLFLADVKSLSDLIYASHGDSVALTMVAGRVAYSR